MDGIRIYSKQRFSQVFAPVLPELVGLSWLAGPETFEHSLWLFDPDDGEEDPDSAARLTRFCGIVRPVKTSGPFGSHVIYGYSAEAGLMPDYIDFVSSDWSSLYGLSDPVADAIAWFDGYFSLTGSDCQLQRADYLGTHCAVVLRSVDSAFYEIFAAPRLLEPFRRHLTAHGVRHEAVRLSGAVAL